MIAVPAATPVTTPAASIEAMDALLVLHVQPAVVSVSVMVLPASQTAVGPVMADGFGLVVIVATTKHPPESV